MHKALFAERLLLLIQPSDRAETIAGDLVEEADQRGFAWFAGALVGVLGALFFHAFATARVRTLRALMLGLLVWASIYVALRVGGALLGLQPIPNEHAASGPISPSTLAYLAGTLVGASLLTGLALGRASAPGSGGISPVMPLAVFWATVAVVGLAADLAAGRPTWYCTVVYLGAVPLCYIAPLLVGSTVRQAARAPLGGFK